MTIFAGAYSLHHNEPLPTELLGQLRRCLSRFDKDVPLEFSAPGFYAAKVDIGAFGADGHVSDGLGDTTLVSGEPLLRDGEGRKDWNRSQDVAVLHETFGEDGTEGLRKARGSFCGIHYSARSHGLKMYVDKTGVRPLYVWCGERFVVFATALRILEQMDFVPKQFDMRGVTEVAVFGFALGERTPYRDIKMLAAGQLIEISNGAVRPQLYWRWDGPLTETDYESAVQRAYDEFMMAIERRQRDSSIAAAFLSGGLDSRAIVGGLRAGGRAVHAVNFAPDGSQDQVFAKLVGEKLGVHYTQIQTNAGNVTQGYRKAAVREWIDATFSDATGRGREQLMWSGDGGSVGLGNVYMTPEIVAAMEQGDSKRAIALFTQGLPKRIIKRSSLDKMLSLPFRGIEEELNAIHSPDRGRAFHLFLMLNDQRRHLAQHFENIDVERIEFQLPFFDADFLDSVLRLPNDWLMAHRFYMDWLAKFPNQLASVPWQAYPGHIPCTLPSPAGLKYQWDVYYDKRMYSAMRSEAASKGYKMLASARFPAHLIDRKVLRLASLLTKIGLRDYSYLINTASIYHRYWELTTEQAAV